MAERLLIDTSVLIDFRRGHRDAREFVPSLIAADGASVHPVAIGELIDGARDRRVLLDTQRFLLAFRRVMVKGADFDTGLVLHAEPRLRHGIGWPDCLIAATWQRTGLPLVTLNDKHFRPVRGMSVVRPY